MATLLKTIKGVPSENALYIMANRTPALITALMREEIDWSTFPRFSFTRTDQVTDRSGNVYQNRPFSALNAGKCLFFYGSASQRITGSSEYPAVHSTYNDETLEDGEEWIGYTSSDNFDIRIYRNDVTQNLYIDSATININYCAVNKSTHTRRNLSASNRAQGVFRKDDGTGTYLYNFGLNFNPTTTTIEMVDQSGAGILTNCRIFKTSLAVDRYSQTGDTSGEYTGGADEEPAEDRTTVLFYNDRVSVTTFGFNDTADYFTHSIQFKIQYKTNAGEKITEPRNSIVGYVKSSVDPVTFSNIEWVYNKNVKIVECKWSYGLVGGTKHTGTKPPAQSIPEILCFYDQAQIDNKVYKAKFGTNMVIFANKSDAERFADGDKTVRPLYDGHSGRFDDTGDIGDKYSYNTQSYAIDNDMSSVWILTKEQLNELASALATGLTKSEAESGRTLLNITKTTARSFTAQAEPVNMICDLFWVPIDVSEFCITHTDHLQFGQDTYGAAGALDEFVDETTGQVVKAARTSSRSIEALTGGIFETIGSAVSDSKLNVRSESVTPPPSNT